VRHRLKERSTGSHSSLFSVNEENMSSYGEYQNFTEFLCQIFSSTSEMISGLVGSIPAHLFSSYHGEKKSVIELQPLKKAITKTIVPQAITSLQRSQNLLKSPPLLVASIEPCVTRKLAKIQMRLHSTVPSTGRSRWLVHIIHQCTCHDGTNLSDSPAS
jgi:hypothetical protein